MVGGVLDDPTFPYRVAFGLTVFAVLGAIDLRRNPEDPRRLKEYAFLFGVTGATMLYGLAHDAVTFAIAPEYFVVMKGLGHAARFGDVARLALMASWTAGLAVGLGLLVANHPSPRFAQLGYRHLARFLLGPLAGAVAAALGLGGLALAFPVRAIATLGLAADSLRDPAPTAVVWAAHIGTYAGAALGLLGAVAGVRRGRRKLVQAR